MAEARGTFYDLPIANWNLFGSAKFPTSVQVLREMVFNLLCICWEIIALEVVEDFDAEPVHPLELELLFFWSNIFSSQVILDDFNDTKWKCLEAQIKKKSKISH